MRTIPSLSRTSRRLPAVLPLGALALLIAALVAASTTLLAGPPQSPAGAAKLPAPGVKLQVAQAWIRELFGTGIAPGMPDRAPPQRQTLPEFDDRPVPRERPAPFSGTYRTVCVRLCDGFYFPMSFSTSRSHFAKDAARCEESCPNGGRLFVHPTGVEDEPAHMTDLQGKPYSEIPNAYRSQRQYVPNCTCRGNPWDPQEVARHQAYADAPKKTAADAGKPRTASVSPRRSSSASAIAGRRTRDDD